jgi:hypothetical protein
MNVPTLVVQIVEPVRELVTSLVEWDLPSLEKLVPDWKLHQDAHLRRIQLYPCKLSQPPEKAYSAIGYSDADEPEQVFLPRGWKSPMMHIVKTITGDWGVDCFLWTQEEGLSALSIILTVGIRDDKMQIVNLEDISVH